MVTTAWTGAYDADVVAVLIDAKKGLDDEAETIMSRKINAMWPYLL